MRMNFLQRTLLVPDIIAFNEAIADSEQYSKRHLLLGNGFSIGCRAEIFHYASLYGEADFSELPKAKEIFQALDTQDFEVAIETLESGAKIFPIYAPERFRQRPNNEGSRGLR